MKETKSVPTVIDVNFPEVGARPVFSHLLERMIILDATVRLHSETDMMSLIQAGRRYSCIVNDGGEEKRVKCPVRLHTKTIGDNIFLAKIKKTPDEPSPLDAYERQYRTTYGLWKELATMVRTGKVAEVRERREAYRVINSLRRYYPDTKGKNAITERTRRGSYLVYFAPETMGELPPVPLPAECAHNPRKKVARKAAKKVARKAVKRVAKKAVKRAARKTVKKVAVKKAPRKAAKKVARKAVKKVAKKAVKRAARKKGAR